MLSLSRTIRFAGAAAAALALAAPAAQARPSDLAARHQETLLGAPTFADTAVPGGHKVALGGTTFAVGSASTLSSMMPTTQLPPGHVDSTTFAVGSASTLSSMMPTTQLPPDRVDKIGVRSHFPAFAPSVPIVLHTTENGGNSGFDWSAAALGAGSVLGIVLLGGTAIGLRGRRRVAIS
jgi:hypothetical protein